jgi:hypothetical protein
MSIAKAISTEHAARPFNCEHFGRKKMGCTKTVYSPLLS